MTGVHTGPGFVTLAITSGKGGVGKTNVAVNLAVALARLRHRVAILDGDFGLGNADVLLGLSPNSHIGSVLAGDARLPDILVDGPLGVKLIPSGSGLQQLTALTPAQWTQLDDLIDGLAAAFDFLIIDTAAGISENVTKLAGLAERVLVVTAIEPTAVVDAYAAIKVMSATSGCGEIGLLVNGARDASDAALVFSQLDLAARRFLDLRLTSYGFIPHDPAVQDAVLMQRPIVEHCPQSAAGRSFRMLAARVAGLPRREERGLRLVGRASPLSRAGSAAMRLTEAPVDYAERDRLVQAHIGLVKATAHRLAQRLPAQVEVPDLISIGVLGLIDAAGRYRPRWACRSTRSRAGACTARCSMRCVRLDWAPRSAPQGPPRSRCRTGRTAPSAASGADGGRNGARAAALAGRVRADARTAENARGRRDSDARRVRGVRRLDARALSRP